MLRLTFFLAGFLSLFNVYLSDSVILQILSTICAVFTIGVAFTWPEPLPPPPPPDLWSEAPSAKEREMRLCSNCGKSVDFEWSMCPYCSKKV